MLRFTRHGLREMLLGTILLFGLAAVVAFLWPGLIAWIGLPLFVVWIWLFSFFRDPERAIPDGPRIMVSPADGLISDIQQLERVELLGGPGVRVGIFLSVFNVHVNRAPCDGTVTAVAYKKGKFINAMSHGRASEENESNTLVIADSAGRPIAVVRQIVGLIARRIVCTAQVGDVVQRGQRIGMIKFGSRTELYIPAWLEPKVQVEVGQKVRGAMDVIATLGDGGERTVASSEKQGDRV